MVWHDYAAVGVILSYTAEERLMISIQAFS